VALGKAAVPVGIAIGAAFAAAQAATIKFAAGVTAASASAIQLGSCIEKFDQMRAGFESLGVSAKNNAPGLQSFKAALDQLDVARVNNALKEIEERNYGQGSAQLKVLTDAANGVGAAAEAANKALVKLGLQDATGLNAQTAALQKLGITTTDMAAAFPQAITNLAKMGDSANRSALAIAIFGQATGTELIQSLRTGGAAVDEFSAKVAGMLTGDAENKANALSQAINRLEAAWSRFGSVTIAPIITAEVNAVTAALQKLQAAIDNFSWETFKAAAISAGDALKYFTIQGQVSLGLQWAWSLGGWDALIGKIAQAGQSLLQFLGLASQAAAIQAPGAALPEPGGVPQMAHGGLLGGRGTGTSDSNLAWVSRGEHIMPARAVQQPGVLALLEALRRSGGDLSRVLGGMGRFALGGMVRGPIPAYAAGGLAGGGNHVTIQFPGLPAISGLRASSDVVEQLHRAAALAQVRSGGRKPSRYS